MFGPAAVSAGGHVRAPETRRSPLGETPWVPAAGRGGAAAGLGLMACTTAVASSAFSSATRKRTKEWSAWLRVARAFVNTSGAIVAYQATDDLLAEYDPLVLGDPQTLHQRRQVPLEVFPQFGLGSSHQRDLAARAMSRDWPVAHGPSEHRDSFGRGRQVLVGEGMGDTPARRPLVRAPCEVGESTPRLLAVSSPPDPRFASRARARCRGRGAPLTSKRRAHLRCARAAIPS